MDPRGSGSSPSIVASGTVPGKKNEEKKDSTGRAGGIRKPKRNDGGLVTKTRTIESQGISSIYTEPDSVTQLLGCIRHSPAVLFRGKQNEVKRYRGLAEDSWRLAKERVRRGHGRARRRPTIPTLLLPLVLLIRLSLWTQEPETGRVINSLSFTGQRNISEKTLRRVADLEPGSEWSTEIATRVQARLSQWPYLAGVSDPVVDSRPDGQVDVLIPVVERPTIGSVTFSGNDAGSDADLRKAIRLRIGDPYLPEAIRRTEEALVQYYHGDGFLIAVVESGVRPRGSQRDVTFLIREGQRVHLTAVTLMGADQISPREALKVLRNQPRRLFGLASKGYYLPRLLENDLRELEQFYGARGFIEVEVGLEAIRFNLRRTGVELVLRVNEGRRWKFGGVRIEGNKLFPTALLEKVVDLPPGGYYDRDLVAAGRDRLSRFYQDQAGLLPQISPPFPEPDDENARLTLIFTVTERPHLRVEEVTVTGNTLTRDRIVRQDLTLRPGDLFTLTEVERSLKRIRKRGIFRDVHAGTTPGGQTVVFEVTEQEKPGYFEVGGGASSGSGGVGVVRVTHSNFDLFRFPRSLTDWKGAFVGGGQKLEVLVMPGNRESEYNLRFEEPYFFKQDLALSLSFGGSIFSWRTYDESHITGRARLRQFLDEDRRLSVALSYVADLVDIEDVDSDAPPAALEDAGTTFFSYPRLALEWDDTVPNFFSGSTGFAASARLDLADSLTGAEMDFWRYELRADYLVALFDRFPDFAHKLHVNVRFSQIDGRGGDETHIAERFYLGGPRSFRGFKYRRLGPHQGKTPIGGEAMIYGSVKYSLPLFWREVRAVGVFDWGELEPMFSDLDTGRFRTAAGGGLQVRLPAFGKLDLYWSAALSKEEDDREQIFGFTLGVKF